MLRSYPTTQFGFIVLLILVTACSGNDTAWTLVELLSKGEQVQTATVAVEVRNCGIVERKTHDCSAGTMNDLSVSLGGSIGAIDASVGNSLGIGRNSGQSLNLDSPPEGFIYRYTVNEEYHVAIGNVRARSSTGQEQVASYTFHASCSLRIETRNVLACTENAPPMQATPIQSLPTQQAIRPQATKPPVVTAPTVLQGQTPLRNHETTSIGSGVLANVTYSDGMAPISNEKIHQYGQLQLINPTTTSDGCGVAMYNTNTIWFGSGSRTTITVNGVSIGELYQGTGNHGYIFEWAIKVNDRICVTPISTGGFHFGIGPDVYIHYDSYCYRGHC